MKSLFVFTLTMMAIMASNAQASVWISCGTGKLLDGGIFEKQEAQFSSTDDDFSGSVGGTWNFKRGDDEEWLAPNKRINAKTTKKHGVTTVEVAIVIGKTVGHRPVGTRYVLTDIYSDEPTLEKSNLAGGFAGSRKLGTYKCISGND